MLIICRYNKINGTFCSENSPLLTKILPQEWNFKGITMSDWVRHSIHDCICPRRPRTGNAIPDFPRQKLLKAVQSGEVSEDFINARVEKLLDLRNTTRPSHGEGEESSEIVEETSAAA